MKSINHKEHKELHKDRKVIGFNDLSLCTLRILSVLCGYF
jgi:hypothetical protein